MGENRLLVNIDYTTGNYIIELISPSRERIKSIKFPIRGRDNLSGEYRENFRGSVIRARRRELRKRFNFSRATSKKIDTTLFKALERFDEMMPATNFRDEYLNEFAKYDTVKRHTGEDKDFFEDRVATIISENFKKKRMNISYNVPLFRTRGEMTFWERVKGRRAALAQVKYSKARVTNFWVAKERSLGDSYESEYGEIDDLADKVIKRTESGIDERDKVYTDEETLSEIRKTVREMLKEKEEARKKAEEEKSTPVASAEEVVIPDSMFTFIEDEVPESDEIVDVVEDEYEQTMAMFRQALRNITEGKRKKEETVAEAPKAKGLVMPDFLGGDSAEVEAPSSTEKTKAKGLVMPDFLGGESPEAEASSETEEKPKTKGLVFPSFLDKNFKDRITEYSEQIAEEEEETIIAAPEPKRYTLSEESRALWRRIMEIITSWDFEDRLAADIKRIEDTDSKVVEEQVAESKETLITLAEPEVVVLKNTPRGRVRPTRRQRIQAAKKAARSETPMERNARLKREKEERNKNRVPLTPEEIAERKAKRYEAKNAETAKVLAQKAEAKKKARAEKARIAQEKYQEKLKQEQEAREKLEALKKEDETVQETIDVAVGSFVAAILARKEAEENAKEIARKKRVEAIRGQINKERENLKITGRVGDSQTFGKKTKRAFDRFKKKYTRKLHAGMKRIKEMKFKPSSKTKGRIIKGAIGFAVIAMLFTGSSRIANNINSNLDNAKDSVAFVVPNDIGVPRNLDEVELDDSSATIIIENPENQVPDTKIDETTIKDIPEETSEVITEDAENEGLAPASETEIGEGEEEVSTQATETEENIAPVVDETETEGTIPEESETVETNTLSAQEIVDNLQIGSSIEIEEGAYWEAPEETGRHGHFENHNDHGLVVTYIDITTPDGMTTIKNAGKTIAELRQEFIDKGYSADQIHFSVHFEDNEGHILGWVKDGSLVTNIENQNNQDLNQDDNQR